MSPDQDIAACAGIVQKGDPDRFLAVMSAPVEIRETLFPIYAFNVEVARAPWVTEESMIAEMRLQWWRDALEEIATGADVRRHEVVTPLAQAITQAQAKSLDRLIEARRWDIYKDPFEDAEAFDGYLSDTSGLLLQVAAECAAGAAHEVIGRIGAADGLARWFLAIPTLEEKGRMPLVDGRRDAVQALAQRSLDQLRADRKELGRPSPVLAAVLRSAWQAEAILKRVAGNPDLVAQGAVESAEFRKKISLISKSLTSNW